ncbi:MAG: hypothetical protein Q9170_005534 [Blastenia crenularia]
MSLKPGDRQRLCINGVPFPDVSPVLDSKTHSVDPPGAKGMMRSLLDYLTSSDPTLDCHECSSGGTTQSAKFTYDSPEWLQQWTDFEYDALLTMYGGSLKQILESRFDLKDFSHIPRIPFRQIFDEGSLEAPLVKWNQSMVTEALAKAQAESEDDPLVQAIYMGTGGQASIPLLPRKVDKSKKSGKLIPDWAGELRSAAYSDLPRNFLPGETKLSCKWDGSQLRPGRFEKLGNNKAWQGPVKQIYTYCVRAEARYGYLITDKELVALRNRPSVEHEVHRSENPAKDAAAHIRTNGVLEFKRILWADDENGRTSDSAQGLTINLGLWFLHMLVLKEAELVANHEEDVFEGFGDSQEQGMTTPAGNQSQQSFDLNPSQSFRSEISNVRQLLSNAALGQKRQNISPGATTSRGKRTRDEPKSQRPQSRRKTDRSSSRPARLIEKIP